MASWSGSESPFRGKVMLHPLPGKIVPLFTPPWWDRANVIPLTARNSPPSHPSWIAPLSPCWDWAPIPFILDHQVSRSTPELWLGSAATISTVFVFNLPGNQSPIFLLSKFRISYRAYRWSSLTLILEFIFWNVSEVEVWPGSSEILTICRNLGAVS